jgi:putative hemolysin
MVPAPDVVWLDGGLTPQQALDRVADRPYSRYPVAEGSLDRLAGVIHARQLVAAARDAPTAPIRASARATLVVPEAKDLGALMRERREARQHLAIVVDEYGGTAGIVTLGDILEELVGEIEDEFDLPDDTLERVDERTVRVAGSMTIDDFNEALGTDLDPSYGRTLAGLVFNELGRRPKEGDEVQVGDVLLQVEQLDGHRITRLLFSVEADRSHAVAGSESPKTRDDESFGCR